MLRKHNTANSTGLSVENRKEFLLKMYEQLWNNINRHILVPWQSVAVLISTLAVFALLEKKLISLDIASTFILIISSWQTAHVLDSSHWVNRNLLIIGNIERQFLAKEDLRYIHYYFGKHRNGSMFDNFRIQFLLGIAISGLILIYHLENRVLPGIGSPLSDFEIMRCLPYIILIICIILITKLYRKNRKKYRELLKKSPGIESIDLSGGVDRESGIKGDKQDQIERPD
jgi:hypothetical protein